MYINEMRDAMRIELNDESGTIWNNQELDRSIHRAIADLDRFFPLQQSYEETLSFTVSENFTASNNYATLSYRPIKYNSEVVTQGSTTYVRDTDYIMDYINGKIKALTFSGDSSITYTRSQVGINISSLDAIRIDRVEYPYGQVPQQFVGFNIYNNILYITGDESSQSTLSTGKHIVIHYTTTNSAPTLASHGTYPRYMDDVVIRGACAYALLIKSLEFEYNAASHLESAHSILSSIDYSSIDTLLGEINTYLSSASTALSKASNYIDTNMKQALEGIPDHSSINTALSNATTYTVSAGQDITTALSVWNEEVKHVMSTSNIPNAEDYLEQGIQRIMSINAAANVPENYRNYAETALMMAQAWDRKRQCHLTAARTRLESAQNCLTEAQYRIADINSYISEAEGWNNICTAYINSASAYINAAQIKMQLVTSMINSIESKRQDAASYISLSTQSFVVATNYRNDGKAQLDSYTALLRDRLEIRGQQVAQSAVKQLR